MRDSLDFINHFLDQTRDASIRAAEVETIRRMILGPSSQEPEQAWRALQTVYLDTAEPEEVRQAAAAALHRISLQPNQPWQAQAETLLTQTWRSGHDLYREPEFLLELARLWQELSLLDLLLLPGQDPWDHLMQLRAQLQPLFEPEHMTTRDPRVLQRLARNWREQSTFNLFKLAQLAGQTHREDLRLLPVLQYAARHPDFEVRQVAPLGLAWVGEWHLVVQALQDEASKVRAAAADVLGTFARGELNLSPPLTAEMTTALKEALQDNDATVRRFALRALRLLKVHPLPALPPQSAFPPSGEVGATLARFPWRSFLAAWSWRLLQFPLEHLPDEILQLPDEAIQSGWIGSPGATQAQLLEAERRLGRQLPPSYREFLQLTNGWPCGLTQPLLPIEQVDLFQVKDPDYARAWIEDREGLDLSEADHRVYGEQQDPMYFHFAYLQTALQISKQQDGYVYLLNPEVVTPEGEWEAWILGHKILGAQRWPSFWEMVQEESRTEFPGFHPSDAAPGQAEPLLPEE